MSIPTQNFVKIHVWLRVAHATTKVRAVSVTLCKSRLTRQSSTVLMFTITSTRIVNLAKVQLSVVLALVGVAGKTLRQLILIKRILVPMHGSILRPNAFLVALMSHAVLVRHLRAGAGMIRPCWMMTFIAVRLMIPLSATQEACLKIAVHAVKHNVGMTAMAGKVPKAAGKATRTAPFARTILGTIAAAARAAAAAVSTTKTKSFLVSHVIWSCLIHLCANRMSLVNAAPAKLNAKILIKFSRSMGNRSLAITFPWTQLAFVTKQ
jgi:hypothetical protein